MEKNDYFVSWTTPHLHTGPREPWLHGTPRLDPTTDGWPISRDEFTEPFTCIPGHVGRGRFTGEVGGRGEWCD
jgi:hypothetical protein